MVTVCKRVGRCRRGTVGSAGTRHSALSTAEHTRQAGQKGTIREETTEPSLSPTVHALGAHCALEPVQPAGRCAHGSHRLVAGSWLTAHPPVPASQAVVVGAGNRQNNVRRPARAPGQGRGGEQQGREPKQKARHSSHRSQDTGANTRRHHHHSARRAAGAGSNARRAQRAAAHGSARSSLGALRRSPHARPFASPSTTVVRPVGGQEVRRSRLTLFAQCSAWHAPPADSSVGRSKGLRSGDTPSNGRHNCSAGGQLHRPYWTASVSADGAYSNGGGPTHARQQQRPTVNDRLGRRARPTLFFWSCGGHVGPGARVTATADAASSSATW